jgi:hypothetical protein
MFSQWLDVEIALIPADPDEDQFGSVRRQRQILEGRKVSIHFKGRLGICDPGGKAPRYKVRRSK